VYYKLYIRKVACKSTKSIFISHRIYFTNGIDLFADCLKHSAKPEKHSAQALSSVALGKEGSANSTSAKSSLSSTFFGHLAQTLPSARQYSANKSRCHGAGVTETASLPSVLGDTRQKSYLCRVSPNTLGKEGTSLPSVYRPALGKGSMLFKIV
jgi:hypothetical protein